ncbi:MAG: Mn2+-dependent serine/threonine protein kinase [Cenarchaeum symbiont of Oopsacas minuta]|nr:Mn2+-dependent serine/threonine protein kinase [Cenarchaeum symbiont of Oopsacas minuta]
MNLIKKGAEGDIYKTKWLGKDAILKIRKAKSYRNADLDKNIRYSRTVREAQNISRARSFGVYCPLIYFIDTNECSIIMEYVNGTPVRNLSGRKFDNACEKIGSISATLHKNKIMHGDMTTSNFLVDKNGICTIDFGLTISTTKIDDLAVDLRLFKEALSSAHSKQIESAWKKFLVGYKKITANNKTFEKILKRVEIIEGRGRYAKVV